MRKKALAALALFVLAGCGSQEEAKLSVGTVDIMRVMEERDETRAIKLEWASQAGDTYMRLSDVKDPAEAQALQEEIAKRSKEWQEKVDTFMEESINLIESETESIAKERGIDIVLVDNPLTQNIRFREGEDLSFDVAMKLQNRSE